MVYSCTWILSLVVVLLQFFTIVTSQWCSGVLSGDDCIVYAGADKSLSWAAANQYCYQQYGGNLVSVQNSSRQSAMEALMTANAVDNAWTGGREALNVHWLWSIGNVIIEPQGCYSENLLINREFSVSVPLTAPLQTSFCTSSCHLLGYQYAGLFNGVSCYCSSSFGRYGTSSGCTKRCAGQTSEFCGGVAQNTVYYITGAYAKWAENQPNNYGGYQYCAAMDTSVTNNLTVDERCDSNYGYVCQIDSCQVNRTTAEGYYVTSILSHCYFISKLGLSWTSARNSCVEKSGDLVKLDNEFVNNEVATLIKLKGLTFQKYWIGLTKYRIDWSSGNISTGYSNFRSTSPTIFTDGCIAISSSDNYKWSDIDCSLTRNFFCQYNQSSIAPTTTTQSTTTTTSTTPIPTTTTTTIPTTTTTPTTTTVPTTIPTTTVPTTTTTSTTTTIPTTTTNTPTTTPKPTTTISTTTTQSTTLQSTASVTTTAGAAITPIAGQATAVTDNTLIIVMSIVLSIVLIIIILCIILFICLRRHNERRKMVQPDPEEIIPYEGKPDPYIKSTPIMAIDTSTYLMSNGSKASLLTGDTSLGNVHIKKKNHSTQTMEPPHNLYTNTIIMTDSGHETKSQTSTDNGQRRGKKLTIDGRRTRKISDSSAMDRELHGNSYLDYSRESHEGNSLNTTFDDLRASQRLRKPPIYVPPESGDERLWSRNGKRRARDPNESGEISTISYDRHSDRDIKTTRSHNKNNYLNTEEYNEIDGLSQQEYIWDHRSISSPKSPKAASSPHNLNTFSARVSRGRKTESPRTRSPSPSRSPKKTRSPSPSRSPSKSRSPSPQRSTNKGRNSDKELSSSKMRQIHSDDEDVYHGVVSHTNTSTPKKPLNGMSVHLVSDGEASTEGSMRKKRKTRVCPECGKNITMLRKHLMNKHDYVPGSVKLKHALQNV